MFQYLSCLVEIGAFVQIDISCLIIGHTHASIDQFFSALLGKMKRTTLVATPESLRRLLDTLSPRIDNNTPSRYKPPLLHIELFIVYDYVSAFEPYLNKQISGHQLPYNFKLYMVCFYILLALEDI